MVKDPIWIKKFGMVFYIPHTHTQKKKEEETEINFRSLILVVLEDWRRLDVLDSKYQYVRVLQY